LQLIQKDGKVFYQIYFAPDSPGQEDNHQESPGEKNDHGRVFALEG
jgi:hypothetical protein